MPPGPPEWEFRLRVWGGLIAIILSIISLAISVPDYYREHTAGPTGTRIVQTVENPQVWGVAFVVIVVAAVAISSGLSRDRL
jgi:hypothetical protein